MGKLIRWWKNLSEWWREEIIGCLVGLTIATVLVGGTAAAIYLLTTFGKK